MRHLMSIISRLKTITVKIDSDLYKWLNTKAKLLRLSKSAIVRDALIAHRNELRANSVTARAGDLVGKFNTGLTELATSKKHMKGFGDCRR